MINYTVNIIGVGGIGSWVATQVIRVGCQQLVLYDADIVEMHNFENQDYDFPQHLGRPKVKALEMQLLGVAQWHKDLGREIQIVARNERVTADSILRGIVIVCVDSIQSRREIFTACRFNPAIPLYIEAGAGENCGIVRALLPHDKDQVRVYEKLLEAYSEDGLAPCVSPHMGGQFASLICEWLRRFNEGLWFQTLMQSFIDYRVESEPTVATEPII